MHTALMISLYFYLAMEALGFLMAIMDANKPRPEVDPGTGCIGALLLLGCAAAPFLLSLSVTGWGVAGLAAVWLALGLLYDTAQFVRQVHGKRGPRTPVSTMITVTWSLVNMGVILYLLLGVGV